MKLFVWIVVIFLGMHSSRAAFVAMRGGWATRNPLYAALGLISTFGTIGLLVWGFWQFDWYWPTALFLGISVLTAFTIRPANLGFWLMIGPALDLMVLAGGIYLLGFAR